MISTVLGTVASPSMLAGKKSMMVIQVLEDYVRYTIHHRICWQERRVC